ncbi:MAG: hypothetical protein ACRCSV_03940 [Chlamydiales bacterium]
MTNAIPVSSTSLTFNDSWLAHAWFRIYRLAFETIELLSNAFSFPLVQPYSGKKLYQLLDTFRHSVSNSESYNEARLSYADNIIKALKGEKNIFEKTKQVRSILNTHIIGLSILQERDKKSLSDHVGYTLLPSLINEFGIQLANRAVLALDELDNKSEKNINQYAKLYRDLTLQQPELDSFVKALQELNGNVSRNILIHELILSRNKHLTEAAKNQIKSILQDGDYIKVKLERKLHLIEQLKSQTEEKEVNEEELTCELKTQRDLQLEALDCQNRSMFFPLESSNRESLSVSDSKTTVDSSSSDSTIIDDQLTDEFENVELSSEPFPEEAYTTQEVRSPEIPIGIANTNQNCWYNAALQIMSNTPIRYDINAEMFSKHFPKIAESFQLYQNSFLEQSDIRQFANPAQHGLSHEITEEIKENLKNNPKLLKEVQSYRKKKRFAPLNLTNQMQDIRAEIHNKLSKEFAVWGDTQEDSKQFLYLLLEKLSIDIGRVPISVADLFTYTYKHVLIDKAESQRISLETLFAGTDYMLNGLILHSGYKIGNKPFDETLGHYYAAVKRNNTWYLCNDTSVTKISREALQQHLDKNSAFIIASRIQPLHVVSK